MVHQHPFTIVVFYLLRVDEIVYQNYIKLRILACLKRTCKEVKTCIDEINWILHPEPIFDILNYTMPVINCSDIPSTNCSEYRINKLSKKWNEDSKIVFWNEPEVLERYMRLVQFKNKNIYVYNTIFKKFDTPILKKKNRCNGIIEQQYNIFFISCTFNACFSSIDYQEHQNINIFFINCIFDYNNNLKLKNIGSTYFINCKTSIRQFRFDNQNEIKFINCTIIASGYTFQSIREQIHINKCNKFYMCNCKISLNQRYFMPYTRFITFTKDYNIGDIIINNNIFYSIRINKNDVKHITEYYNLNLTNTNYTIINVFNKDIDLADIARNINNNVAAFGLYYYNNEEELWIYDDIFNSNTWNSYRIVNTKLCPQSPSILIFNTKLTIQSKNKSKMTLESPAYYNIDNNRINTLQLMYDEHSKQFKLTNNTVCKSMCVKLIIKRNKISEIQFDANKIKNKVFKLRETACHTSNLVRIFMDLFNNPGDKILNCLPLYTNGKVQVFNRKENRWYDYNNFKDLIQADISNYMELKQKYIKNLQSDDYLVL